MQSNRQNFFRISWILIRYRLLAIKHSLGTVGFKKNTQKRQATKRKSRITLLGASLIFFFLVLSLFVNVAGLLSRLLDPKRAAKHAELLGLGEPCEEAICAVQRAIFFQPSAAWQDMPQTYWLGLMIFLWGLVICTVLISFSKMYQKTDDITLEWFSSFPISLRAILLGRFISESLLGFYFWAFILPLSIGISIMADRSWYQLLPGVIFSVYLLCLAATGIGLAIDSWMRMNLSPKRQRDLRSVMSLLLVLIFMSFFYGIIEQKVWFWSSILKHFDFLQDFYPVAILTQIFIGGVAALSSYFHFLFWGIGLLLVSLMATEHCYKEGIYNNSGFESFRNLKPSRMDFWKNLSLFDFFPVMVRRELTLLARDRIYFIQVIGTPALLVLLSAIGGRSSDNFLESLWTLMLPCMIIASSSPMILVRENSSLWQLASVPRKLTEIFAERQRLWVGIAYLTCLGMALWYEGLGLFGEGRLLYKLFASLLAIWMFENQCRAISLFFHDPIRIQQKAQVPFVPIFLGMALLTILIWGVIAPPWSSFVVLTLMFGLTLALRQKTNEYEPYILDPVAAPPVKATLSDGLIAALFYFTLQSFFVFVFTFFQDLETSQALTWASGLAGIMVFFLINHRYNFKQVEDGPKFFAKFSFVHLLLSCGFAGLTITAAYYWQSFAYDWGFWQYLIPDFDKDSAQKVLELSTSFLIFGLLIAPIVEEFIFRGLIFAGLIRYLGIWPACLFSSLLFAIIHPPIALGPIFLLGVTAAFLYKRTGSLAPSIALHMAYNAGVFFII